MGDFRHPALKQLTDQQVRYAPPAKRREQLAQAGKLLGGVDIEKQYPYQFVCFRLTGFRTNSYPDLLISGDDLRHDLRLFIDRLDRSLPPVRKGPSRCDFENVCRSSADFGLVPMASHLGANPVQVGCARSRTDHLTL